MIKEKYIERECSKHGLTTHILEEKTRYRCKTCRNRAVANQRLKNKSKLVAHFGGKCICCGYNKYEGALEFHHKDPKEKDFQLGTSRSKAYNKMLAEAEKCILVCSNCHKEIHAGLIKLEDIEDATKNSKQPTPDKDER